jgi:hypothetical protein
MSRDLHTTAGKIEDLRDRVEEAVHGGSERAVEKQHSKGKKSARERIELLVDAADYKNLVEINWLTPLARFWTQIGSTTNYFEQYLRAVLDLPLGSTEITSAYTVTGKLKSDPASDDYRPYLHLMARNPNLKFDQSIKQVAISGSELESLLTEVIHAQQYYSGEIEE